MAAAVASSMPSGSMPSVLKPANDILEPRRTGTKALRPMPGTLEPDDALESQHATVSTSSTKPVSSTLEPADDILSSQRNPFEELARIQQEWREREPPASWSAGAMVALDLEGIDWQSYDPPEALHKTPNVTSQVLLELVQQSVENIKAQATEEYRRRCEEQEQRIAAENEAKKAKRSQDLFLPIIIVEEPTPEEKVKPSTGLDADQLYELTRARAAAVQLVSRSKKPSLLSFPPIKSTKYKPLMSRLLRRKMEKNEVENNDSDSSTMEALRTKLRESSNVNDGSGNLTAEESREVVRASRLNQAEPAPEELVECVSCLDEFSPRVCVKVPCHSYCSDCFAHLISISVQNEQQWPPKCCLNEIPFRTILRYVPEELRATFRQRSDEWNIPVSDRMYCSRPACSQWIKPDQVNHATRTGRCDRRHETCTMCRGEAHGNLDCPQDRDMNLTNQLAEEEGWKRCFNCHALVEHREACQHMTCRCGTQFCYVCNRVWRTCSCTMQQLNSIKDAAQARRQERRRREEEESEELRQMLAQIADFERAEAVRAEIERQEQIRLEEERQQRELEARARQEIIRRMEVERHFVELRAALDLLHSHQSDILDTQLETDAISLAEEARSARETLEHKTATELADVAMRSQTQMSEKERTFTEDFSIRSAAEREIVDSYQKQLEAFWHNKSGGRDEIEKAMLPLRKKMEQGYAAWQTWKDGQLNEYRERLDEKRAIREELAYSARERLNDKYEQLELDLVRRSVAEKKWLHMVVLERERILAQAENEEMEGDADSIFAADNSEASSLRDRDGSEDAGEGRASTEQDQPEPASEDDAIGQAL